LHGVWHFEKGMLFTIGQIIVRPGQAALDYINGKRIRYYNVFYLCLLLIGLNVLLVHLYHSGDTGTKMETTGGLKVLEFLSTHIKLIVLGIVPILALNALIIYRKMRLNIAEHFIIGGICLAGSLIISVLFFFTNFLVTFDVPLFFGYLEI